MVQDTLRIPSTPFRDSEISAMRASSSETPSVSTLDAFYEELATTADNEGLCLPWYKTSLVVRTPEVKRFRSEMTLPGLRLRSRNGQQYFIPEAKFTGIAENRKEAEDAAASSACRFLKNFTQSTELDATEWIVDQNNPLYRTLIESYPEPSASAEAVPEMPSEGHHLLVIAPVVPQNIRNKKEIRPKARVHDGSSSSLSSRSSKIGDSSSSSSNGENLNLLSNELHLLKTQIEKLNMLVERHHPPPNVASPSASTSFQTGLVPQ